MLRSRPLAPGEVGLVRELFGEALDPAPVRVVRQPLRPLNRPFVAGRLFGRYPIVWPAVGWSEDFGAASTPLGRQAVFVHELVHVWQAQRGLNLLFAKLRAGDGPAAYAYGRDGVVAFERLNLEQQAMAVQHAFLYRRTGACPGAPWPADAYAGWLPFGPPTTRA